MAVPERTLTSLPPEDEWSLCERLGEKHHLPPVEIEKRLKSAAKMLAELLDKDGLTSLAYTTKEGLVITINFFGHNGNGSSNKP